MNAFRLPDGRVLIPKRAESEDGTLIGDGYVVVLASSDEALEWQPWTKQAPDDIVTIPPSTVIN